MKEFASLLDRLIATPSRNEKIRLLTDYFTHTPDPDRGYAVAALVQDLRIASIKPASIRGLIENQVDSELFRLSYDYVGDLAETVALMWPTSARVNTGPALSDIITTLQNATRAEALSFVADLFDRLDVSGRWALIKLITGGLRIGVAARLVKVALAAHGGKPASDIEEIWHGLQPPYTSLFDWLEGRGCIPRQTLPAPFRPVMLSHQIGDDDAARIDLAEMAAEWKWDGIRVQAVHESGVCRLYTRTGDDITHSFPDIVDALPPEASIDGELLVFDPSGPSFRVRPFSDLQQRLNRKSVSKRQLTDFPAFIRAYDILWAAGEDLRHYPFSYRRQRLEDLFRQSAMSRMDLSPMLQFTSWDDLAAARQTPPDDAIEGVMLKRVDSPYQAGRPKGEWWKWKREPFLIDCVLMYAQRGHGKRSGLYSDYTFGVWDGETLVPVGKAYHGFTDEELRQIDKFVRDNTVDRFGPVRSVRATADHGLVLEIAFEGLNRSTRHKSGVAMRFPRIHRLRWDKPPNEADTLKTLASLLPPA